MSEDTTPLWLPALAQLTAENLDAADSARAAAPPVVVAVGIFEDGTKADWRDSPDEQTAVQRLSVRYEGYAIYRGGYGTDERGWWQRTWETLVAKNRRARFSDYVEVLKFVKARNPGATVVLDLFGWSRGGDSAIEFVRESLNVGVAVRFLGVFDPVPARGWKAIARILPLVRLPMFYNRPDVGAVCQVLAGEEHSRITRHARVKIDARDWELCLADDHRGVVNYGGRNPVAEKFMETCAATAGVVWRKAA